MFYVNYNMFCNNINNMILERSKFRDELEIIARDQLEYFINLCKEKFTI